MPKHDPEEIGAENLAPIKEQPMTEKELLFIEELKKTREIMEEQGLEIRRLKAIADGQKAALYDQENARKDQSKTGHLRFIDDPTDPIVSWKTVSNVSYVDPGSGQMVADQRSRVTTLRGVEKEMTIDQWNLIKSNQTKFKFLRLDHQSGTCDVQLSTDAGQSYIGEVVKDIPIQFCNP